MEKQTTKELISQVMSELARRMHRIRKKKLGMKAYRAEMSRRSKCKQHTP